MDEGSLVIVHLSQPSEKFWGLLGRLRPEGVTFRGVSLDSFDDWVRGIVKQELVVDLATMFVPLFRVEKIFLDEQVGAVESYRQRFRRTVGLSVESYLGLADAAADLDGLLPS